MLLKSLIAAACVAVIAIAGLTFWQEHQRAAVRAVYAEMNDCSATLDKALANIPMYETPEFYALKKRVVDCRIRGLISDREWEAKTVNR